VNKRSERTTVSMPRQSATPEKRNETSAQRLAAPRSRVFSRLISVISVVAELLGAGNRRGGLITLAVLTCGAVLLPVFLLTVFTSVNGTSGSAVLGLMLGLIVDLLAVVLLLGVVTHKMTSRRLDTLTRSLRELGTLTRSLRELGTRTSNLEMSLGEQSETLQRQSIATAAARAAVETAVKDVGNRLQATHNLFALVSPRGPVPQMVGYTAAPDVLLVLVQKFLSLRPSLAIECGSGTSTLFLALAAKQYGINCRLISLEHDLAYAEATRALVADHGVGHLVDVRHAALTTTSLTDHLGPWYDPAAFQDLHNIGLAFVDGPPGDVGPQARYPMVPLLADRLASPCAILLDDMNRPDERVVAERWMAQLEGFSYRYLPLTRGAGIFTRGC
jgi:predicted O-methyltransferase YrrM